jgi:hypothetical protein
MQIDLPSNNFPFQLNIPVKSEYPVAMRVIAVDPMKPATKYADFFGKVDGKRTFELRLPVTPKRLKVVIFNPEVGDIPYGDDPSFALGDVKVSKLREYDVWWNQDTKNFYKFAVEFAQNAGILTAGDKKPHIYRSDDGKFTIDYYNVIYDKASKKMLSTPARIGHNSGVIEVSKQKFLDYSVPMRLVILLHEYAHKYLNPKLGREISYETGADIQGLYVYLGKGWSPIEAHKVFLKVFRNANNKPNHKRYKILRDFIDKYDKGKVARVKKK